MAERRKRSTFYYEGKRYEATGKTQKEADQNAAVKLDKLKRGEVGISSNMTVKAWAKEWLEIYKKPVLADKQYRDYERMFSNYLIPSIGSLRLRDVTGTHLQKILNDRTGWSADRLSKLRTRIHAMFKRAKRSKLIVSDPSEDLTLPAGKNGTHRSITDAERKVFLAVAQTHRAGLLFKVMLYCGLRTGEVIALRPCDIDLDKKRIKVTRALESGGADYKEPKSEAGIREVPIPDEIFSELQALAQALTAEPFELLFKATSGKAYSRVSISREWARLKDEMDIAMGAKYEIKEGRPGKPGPKVKQKIFSCISDDFVPYCLRHTYCTDLQDKGVPINMAKYLMGHSNISVTAKIYTHTTETSIEAAAKLINGGKDGGNEKQA